MRQTQEANRAAPGKGLTYEQSARVAVIAPSTLPVEGKGRAGREAIFGVLGGS